MVDTFNLCCDEKDCFAGDHGTHVRKSDYAALEAANLKASAEWSIMCKTIDAQELMRRWMEFYKGTLQKIAILGHPASLLAQQALDVKVLPSASAEPT